MLKTPQRTREAEIDGRPGQRDSRREVGRDVELKELMVRYQQADPAAVEELVDRLSGPLFGFFFTPGNSSSETEDLLQECWLRIHKSRHTYRPSEPVLPWIYAIARHTKVDGYRRRRRVESREVIPETLPEHLHTCEQQQTGMDGELSRLLESLPRSQKEVILMLKISGMSLKEVAQATSSTVGAVKQKAHRGYKKLRCALEGRAADFPSRR